MLRRLLAVAVLGATMTWAQAPRQPSPTPASTSCQQDGAQCLKTCSAGAKSAELMQCVHACEAKVDACRGPAADAGMETRR
jgi:hypothetical protein